MEFLKGLLSEETYTSLVKELEGKDVKLADLSKGEYVSEDKYLRATKDVESFKDQLKQRDSDLEALKKNSQLNEEQQKKLDDLQMKYESEKQEWEAKLQQNEKDSALEIIIARSGTKDPVALKAHVSNFAKDAEYKDGVIVGLQEHITKRLGDDLKHLSGEAKAGGQPFKTPPKPEVTKEEIIKNQIYGNKGE